MRRLIADLDSDDELVLWYTVTALTTQRSAEAVEPLVATRARLLRENGPASYMAYEFREAAVCSMTPAPLPLALRLIAEPEPEPDEEKGEDPLGYYLADFLRPFDGPDVRAALERYDADVEREQHAELSRRAEGDPVPEGWDALVRWLIDRVARNPYQGDFIVERHRLTRTGAADRASGAPVRAERKTGHLVQGQRHLGVVTGFGGGLPVVLGHAHHPAVGAHCRDGPAQSRSGRSHGVH